ncbi:NRDE family protein [Salinimicrobium flavum]|uniref:NRDE family protein n=1 Tax=Salinimicrobium flavum TaxID=1737065 RepID=A0ABW5ITU1_9FLAO
MCTVTLAPLRGRSKSFVLTSNRDEAPGRETLPPQIYTEAGVKMLFPKDVEAGGTWLGVSERQRLICLLNGEFESHLRKPPYRLSRGVVVKDLLAAEGEDLATVAEDYDLTDIEPFTIIAAEWASKMTFSELVWDGRRKHFRNLEPRPLIWSSSPLYNAEMKQQRENWFSKLQTQEELEANSLLNFHSSAGSGDNNTDVVMDRGFVKTRSISQVILSEEELRFFYRDLATDEVTKMAFSKDLSRSI